MSSKDTIDILNRLVQLHHRSLPVYLSYAAPTWGRGEEQAQDTLKQISDDAARTVDRISEMIMEEGGSVDLGAFPMRYTALHDLAFDYLLDLAWCAEFLAGAVGACDRRRVAGGRAWSSGIARGT